MKDETYLVALLDVSGSMGNVQSDVIGGMNTLLKDQGKQDKRVYGSLYQFDDRYLTTFENIDIKDAPKLTKKNYKPLGSTALYDAVGKTITNMGNYLASLDEKNRPSKVVFVLFSDGCENASREYKLSQIQEMIKHQSEVYNWQFLFLGADISAQVGKDMGIFNSHTISKRASGQGIRAASTSVNAYSSGQTSTLCYSVPESK